MVYCIRSRICDSRANVLNSLTKKYFLACVICALLVGSTRCATNAAGYYVHQHSAPAASSPEALYADASQALADGLYQEALTTFQKIKTNYPYSRFAALADLRCGDIYEQQSKYVEAIDTFQQFLKYHPQHEDALYASLHIADNYYSDIPDDWWIMPPSAEKDQASVKHALRAYNDFLKRFANSPHVHIPLANIEQSAKQKRRVCQQKLVQHEIYVARFYFKKNQYQAAINRLEGLLNQTDGTEADSEYLWILGRSLWEVGDKVRAQSAFALLRKTYPDSPYLELTENYLNVLR